MVKSKKSIILFITISALVVVAIVSSTKPGEIKSDKDQIVKKAIDPAVLEADKKELEILKTKFNYKYDEFDRIGWYEHKNQTVDNSYNRNYLSFNVNSSGYGYLEDHYYGHDWIFHTSVQVIVGNDMYESAEISMYDKNNSEFNGSGGVWEQISYTSNRDNGITKAIADSGDNPIKVRFIGRQDVHDFVLADRDHQAIKDSYRLSQLIQEINSNQ